MAISIAARKNKARTLQKWVCQKISELTSIPWGLEDNKLIQSRPMGQSGTDIILRGEALEQFPFSIECKNNETWHVIKDIEQAKKNMIENTNWLLIEKKNNQKPVVIMDAEIFFNIYEMILTHMWDCGSKPIDEI